MASLEMHILMDAIRAAARADAAKTQERGEEFLAVRRERWIRRPEDIPVFERPQELMEGSAQYVEVRSVGLMGDLCAASGTSSASLPACDVFAGATGGLYLLADFEGRLNEGVIDPVDMARNRVYPTGAALGLLLDFFHVDWKTRVSNATTSPSLAEMLAERLAADPDRSDTFLARVKERYGYTSLRATSDRHIQAYPIEYQAAVDSLKNAPGFHLSVELPILNVNRSRTCEGRRLVIEKPTPSFSRTCRVYTLKHLGRDDLFLEIRESDIAEETSTDGASRRVDFVAPDIQTAGLDGRRVDIGHPGTYSFHRAMLAASGFQMRYDAQGALSTDGRSISVRLTPPPASEGK